MSSWPGRGGEQITISVISSIVPLEVGGTICANPPDKPTELICNAPDIASFEINANAGNDRIAVAGRRR